MGCGHSSSETASLSGLRIGRLSRRNSGDDDDEELEVAGTKSSMGQTVKGFLSSLHFHAHSSNGHRKSISSSALPSPGKLAKEEALSRELNKEYQAKLQFLSAVPLMKRLPKKEHPAVASVCNAQTFEAGDAVIRQGEQGDAFYIIRQGEARIHVVGDDGDEKCLSLLRAGDYFGENSLLRDEPRMASVFAVTALKTFTIKREQFQELGLNAKLQFANRRAVLGGTSKPTKAKEPTPKTAEEYRFIAKALKSNRNLESMIEFADESVKGFIDVMWSEHVEMGQEIIKKDDLDADYFYVVQEGSFEVFGQDIENTEELTHITTIGPGGSFGELALLYLTPRSATVVSKERGLLWVIDRAHFKELLMKVSEEQLKRYIGYLDKVSFLNPLTKHEKEELAKGLVEMVFTQGEDIIEEGDLGSTFYIMYDGVVQILKEGRRLEKLEAEEGRSTQCFGEKALLESEKRSATVRAVSETVKVVCIDRETFMLMLGPLKELMENKRDGKPVGRASRSSIIAGNMDQRQYGKIRLKELKRVALLAYGGFSRVELWEHKITGDTYALKRVPRWYIKQAGIQESIWNEKDVLMGSDSPFIITLFETYCGQTSVSFLMECALGGDLHQVYGNKGLYGSQRHAAYYTACAVLALDHLHERRAIYRDLKPENMMLNTLGHVKLTDFGLAKFVVGKTYTTCGTPDYFAPEVIHSEGTTKAADWWTLGILIFELMVGHPPFSDVNPMQIYQKVTRGIDKVPFPSKCRGDTQELVTQLLRQKPSERLPMRKGGVEALKAHDWYDSMDWDELEDLNLPPPYVPVVRHNKDLNNFSPDPNVQAAQAQSAMDHINDVDDDDWTQDFATVGS